MNTLFSHEMPQPVSLSSTQAPKPAVVKVTCKSAAQLRQVKQEIEVVLARHQGAYLSVSAGVL